MKRLGITFATLAMIAFVSCKNEKKEIIEEETMEEVVVEDNNYEDEKLITINLDSKSGSNARGTVVFIEKNGAVSMEATLTGLEAGTHAIHIHENADCSAEDGTSAGGHWNPTFEQHSRWGDSAGYHRGDIGNFEADDSGNGIISHRTEEWCLGCGDEKRDIMGKSIIVHKDADDFKTQPTGNAGARLSCGGIIE